RTWWRINGRKLIESPTDAFQFSWAPLPGRYEIEAVAVDRSGQERFSEARSIEVLDQSFAADAGGTAAIEAEAFVSRKDRSDLSWQPVPEEESPPDVSGIALGVLEGGRKIDEGAAVDSAPELIYPITFSEPGRWDLWMRVWGPTMSSDSLYYGLNGTVAGVINQGSSFGGWKWVSSPVDVVEPSGQTLHLWMREDGIQIDRFLLSLRGGSPEGVGPEASSLSTRGPEIRWTLPPEGFLRGVPTAFQVRAESRFGEPVVSVSINGTFLEALPDRPETFAWMPDEVGEYVLVVRAIDEEGLLATTVERIQVKEPPSVVLRPPVSGAVMPLVILSQNESLTWEWVDPDLTGGEVRWNLDGVDQGVVIPDENLLEVGFAAFGFFRVGIEVYSKENPSVLLVESHVDTIVRNGDQEIGMRRFLFPADGGTVRSGDEVVFTVANLLPTDQVRFDRNGESVEGDRWVADEPGVERFRALVLTGEGALEVAGPLALTVVSATGSGAVIEKDGWWVIEAEDGLLGAGTEGFPLWQKLRGGSAGANGTGALMAAAGEEEAQHRPIEPSVSASWGVDLSLTEPGRYTLWIRGLAPSRLENSLSWRLGEGMFRPFVFREGKDAWQWSGQPVRVPVEGVSRLDLRVREPGLILDRILLSADPSLVPDGLGPEVSDRVEGDGLP
ncbi:MAG: hypothetical protein AAF514_14235, partial [Verrucomicrobiota bacterium]